MDRKWIGAVLVALPLVIGGLAFAAAQSASDTPSASAQGFVCPVTGEELRCEKCCPLNN